MELVVEDLSIGADHVDGELVLTPKGEIDYGNVARLRSSLLDAARESPEGVVVDLGEVPFLDSTAVSVLIQGKRHLEENGKSMTVRNPTIRVHRTLDLSGVAEYLVT